MIKPHKPLQCDHLIRNREGGFAMVMALALMAFILILLLSLGTLLQLEIHATTQNQSEQDARQNARLGLMVALAELQQLAGPDHRISARGDIRDDARGGARYWTGIWKAAEADLFPEPIGDQDFMAWLVSASDAHGQPLRLSSPNNVGSVNPFDDSWETQVIVSGEVPVEAGLIRINETGAYGWWVGDEGIKAKMNIRDPYHGSTPGSDSWTHQMRSAQRFGVEAMDFPENGTDDYKTWGDLNISQSAIDKSLWPNDLTILDASAREFLHERFHDITMHSYGLPVDVTRGRLRRDLTAAFENEAVFNAYFSGNDGEFFVDEPEFLEFVEGFKTSNPSNNYRFAGPNWDILKSYYNLYKTQLEPGVFPILLDQYHAHADGFADRPYGRNYEGTVNRFDYHRFSMVHPVTARKQYSVGIRFMEVESEILDNIRTTVYLPVIRVLPIMVIFNPYNAFLDYPGGGISSSVNPKIDITAGNKETVSFHLIEIMPQSLGSNFADDYENYRSSGLILRNKIPPVIMEPGESLIFSLEDENYLVEDPFDGDEWHRMTYSAEMINDTNIHGAFDLPVHANYVMRATENGANPRQAGGRLGAFPPSFGISQNELDNLKFTVRENLTTGEVDADSLQIRIRFSDPTHFPFLTDYHGVGPMNVQRFLREFGLGNGQMQWPGEETSLDFDYFLDAQIQPTLASWRYGLRLITDALKPVRFIDTNFRLVILNYLWETGINGTLIGASLIASDYGNPKGIIDGSSWDMPGFWDEETERYQAYWGDSIDGSTSTTHVPLFDIPIKPLLSLGAFQHANLGRYAFHPTYIIGQSYAPPLMPRDRVWHRYFFGSREAIALDLPYLLNQSLWDGYFFSSIHDALDQNGVDELVHGNRTLPNSRHKIYSAYSTLSPADLQFDPDAENGERIFETVARHILVNGAFNINSTSEQAWRALLSAANGLELPVLSTRNGQLLTTNQDSGPVFPRFSQAYGGADNLFSGFRRLTPDQVDQLAGAIVNEVKVRGPFGSLAAFINRAVLSNEEIDPGADWDATESGVLQSAIDQVPSINEQAWDKSGLPPLARYGPAATPHGPQAAGLPGYLLQSDLLQQLGPVLSARSDTFVIRAYGDSRNPVTGRITAQAWCEAVVQRIHEPVSIPTGTEPLEELIAPSNEMGRRFVITAFRWLGSDEI